MHTNYKEKKEITYFQCYTNVNHFKEFYSGKSTDLNIDSSEVRFDPQPGFGKLSRKYYRLEQVKL